MLFHKLTNKCLKPYQCFVNTLLITIIKISISPQCCLSQSDTSIFSPTHNLPSSRHRRSRSFLQDNRSSTGCAHCDHCSQSDHLSGGIIYVYCLSTVNPDWNIIDSSRMVSMSSWVNFYRSLLMRQGKFSYQVIKCSWSSD